MAARDRAAARAAVGALAALLLAAGAARAAPLQACSSPPAPDVAAQDRWLRFAATVRETLKASGARAALVARAGLDLSRWGQRYSHGGVALRDNAVAPWAVRQLYYDCDAAAPRLFDQGLPGFLLGSHEGAGRAGRGFAVLLLLPAPADAALAARALDDAAALQALADRYSANAHPFSTRYQNCNQWLAELLAGAGGAPPGRAAAQEWLRQRGYTGTRFEVGSPALLSLATAVVPWLHGDDHPEADHRAGRWQVSMPASIDAFVRALWPAARRVELCHDGQRVVLRRDGPPLPDDCTPAEGDELLPLD